MFEGKIITHYEYPPIPDRNFDWCATREDYEPGRPIGHGSTPQKAIQELLDDEKWHTEVDA